MDNEKEEISLQGVSHPVHSGTLHLWSTLNTSPLEAYYSGKYFVACPTCELLLADVEELLQWHRNAGPFTERKKPYMVQCKFGLVYILMNYSLMILCVVLQCSSQGS